MDKLDKALRQPNNEYSRRVHGKLKKYLDNGVGTFATVFAGMDNMSSLQINEVNAIFERSRALVKEIH